MAAREEWLGSEKLRLAKLAEARSSALKKDAVKALEPELHRLISGNTNALEQRQGNLADQFDAFVKEKEREGERLLQEEFLKIEREAEEEAEKMRRIQSDNLMELTRQQEADLKKARDMWKKDMEQERSAFETERRRRVTGYAHELEELRAAESDRLAQAAADHEHQMAQLTLQKHDALKDRQEYVEGHMENWQRERLFQIREDQHKKDDASRRALIEQSEAELSMVLAKLDAQAAEERTGLDYMINTKLEAFTSNLNKEEYKLAEEEQVLMGRFAEEHAKAQELQVGTGPPSLR